MKLPLRYVVLGLEIWLGVSAIVIGLYLLVFSIAGMSTNVVPGEFEQFAGFVLATPRCSPRGEMPTARRAKLRAPNSKTNFLTRIDRETVRDR